MSFTFLQPTDGFRQAVVAAIQEAGAEGTDSLDLLIAGLAMPEGAAMLTKLGVDPEQLGLAARRARASREPTPGLTEDAKSAMEAGINRAMLAQTQPDVADLMIGLAQADCLARRLLDGHGLNPTI